ncbi:MAG: RDD family protein [Deltaproteobacteria bacterium]|nr:RDD family protein [Deltaproteobacteria bacterium]
MLCPRCGKDVGESLQICVECGRKDRFDRIIEETSEHRGLSMTHLAKPLSRRALGGLGSAAGFQLRFFAFLVDLAIVSVFVLAAELLFSGIYVHFFERLWELQADWIERVATTPTHLRLAGAYVAFCAAMVCATIFGCPYHVLMESSPLQATLGKAAFGLVVVDGQGRRLTIVRALARHLAKVLSLLSCFTGYLLAGVTPGKRALHDLIVGTYVERGETLGTTRLLITAFGAALAAYGTVSLIMLASTELRSATL